MRLRKRQQGSVRFKTSLVVATASLLLFVFGSAVIYLNFGIRQESNAAAWGDYRSFVSGNWNAIGTWERFNGTTWNAATAIPTSTNGTITIRNGHSVAVTANVTVDQVVVESGATLNINSGILTIANGTGSDLDISGTATQITGGTLTIAASAQVKISSGGTYNHNGGSRTLTGWDVNNGGTYVHNVDNINLPTATWGASSTIKITGVTTSDIKGVNQSFGNFIYNSTLQTGSVQFWENVTAVAGDFTVLSTGTGSVSLQRNSTLLPLNIGGNYYQSAGTFYLTKGAAFTCNLQGTFTLDGGTFVEVESYGLPVLNVYGLFTINSGTFNHSTYLNSLPNEGIGKVNLFNNYVRTGGLHTETATSTGRGEYNFAKTGTQTFSYTGGTITNTVNFTVNSGAILDLADYAITGGGSFTLSGGGGLILASSNGITSSGSSGNVQVTGTRTFSTGGDYTYDGGTAQVTGNGLPSTVRNLTINNSNNITMSGSSSATGIITLVSGKVITGSYELGSTNTNPAGMVSYTDINYVVGNLRRSVSASGSYDFPVGTLANYELANLNFTGMTGFTNILGSFTNADPVEAGNPLTGVSTNGTSIVDILNYGYWAFTPNSAMTGGVYAVTLKEKGHTNASENPFEYCVLKRSGSGFPWESYGTHNNNTQSEIGGIATASRSGLNAFSHFAIGRGSGPLPVALMNFNAKISGNAVVCTWQTATEVNNDYFTLERSDDGVRFETVTRVKGAGYTSNTQKYSYADRHPLEGISYYRLKQTDYDGTTEVFQTVSVNRNSTLTSANTIQVLPNPVEAEFSVLFEANENGVAQLLITSVNGVTILNKKVNFEEGKNSLPLTFPSSAKAGTYVLRVINDQLALPAVKVVKK